MGCSMFDGLGRAILIILLLGMAIIITIWEVIRWLASHLTLTIKWQ
jgi:hypothetical protein